MLLASVLIGLWPVTLAAQTGEGAAKKGGQAEKKDSAQKDTGKAVPKDTGKGAQKGASTGAPKDAGKAAPKADQTGAPKAGALKAAPPMTPDQEEEAGIIDPTLARKATRVETLKDPRAEEALPWDKFKELPAGRRVNDKKINDMVAGTEQLNREDIQNWVNGHVAALTNHNNLKALINPDPPPENATAQVIASVQASLNTRVRLIEQASDALINILQLSSSSPNPQFRREYVQVLLRTLPKLLDNHLIARSQAIIVLAKTSDPEAIPIFVEQLKNPDQVMWVKLWAAQGVTNVAQSGRVTVDSSKANLSAKAISDFLQAEPDVAWPVQMRALEALGSLRLASDVQGQGQAEMASTALRFLADPKAKLEVRAMAAWALGMMRVPGQIKFNYPLIAYHIGQVAADVGDQIDSSFSSSPDQATRLTAMLLYQLLGGLRGDDTVRDSGLMNASNLGQARKPVSEVTSHTQEIAVAAFALTSAATPKRDLPKKQKELAAKVSALKDYLAKNPPADRRLIPGGPEFPGTAPQVAEGGSRP